MQRLFAGLLCFFALNLLCGCAGFKDSFSRTEKGSVRQQVDTKVSTSTAGTNEAKGEPDLLHKTSATAACATTENKTSALVPETAQTCRLDSGVCPPPIVPPVSTPEKLNKRIPVVQLPETSYDFGTMQGDETFTHKFLLKNAGTSELIIKKIIPG